MVVDEYKKKVDIVLKSLLEEIDVPDSKYEEAEDHYTAVANWLNDDESALQKYTPKIYAQGSFALGTVIKPLGDGEYDIDAVCLLDATIDDFTQEELKNQVGDRLKENETYKKMLDPPEGSRRCWTLKYADASKFHLDVLPAIPDDPTYLVSKGVAAKFATSAIQITDKTTWDRGSSWPKSNPRGYREWFRERMYIGFSRRRRLVVCNSRGEVEEVPEYRSDSPLQKLIKLLKRHRDVKYGDDDDKPISIIITTLASQAYDGEETLVEAFENVIPRMRDHLQPKNGVYWIPNPVDPDENFADKWAEKPRKARLFLEWLSSIEEEFANIVDPTAKESVAADLEKRFAICNSKVFKNKVNEALSVRRPDAGIASSTLGKCYLPVVAHQQKPMWPLALTYSVQISASVSSSSILYSKTIHSNDEEFPKGLWLDFHAHTNVPKPFDVYWQIVNTGTEAALHRQLRGGFEPAKSAGVGGLYRRESTQYKGRHWIICHIVKNGRCVARSSEFVINIK